MKNVKNSKVLSVIAVIVIMAVISVNTFAAALPIVKQGESGPVVAAMQYLLRAHGASITADGIFGSGTLTAVKSFQKAKGLPQDGIVGDNTWDKLFITVSQGSKGEAVKAVQYLLKNKYNYSISVDGDFGAGTKSTVVSFQKAKGLSQDGIVGSNTWNALITGSGSSTPTPTPTPSTKGSGIENPTYYSQSNSKWADYPYYNKNYKQNGRVLSKNGCGPTAMAMVVATLANKDVTPVTMADYSMANNYINSNYDTTWDLFPNAAKKYGITCTSTATTNDVKSALADGKHMAIASMKPGHFTAAGHFIVLTGVVTENGKARFVVYDPNSNNGNYGSDGTITKISSGKVKADVSIFYNESANYWIFSK